MREWAANPQPLTKGEIHSFLETVENGIKEEHQGSELGRRRRQSMDAIAFALFEKNTWLSRTLEQKKKS